jgi:NAD(P)-dependent dehydrogenase (short-subunit alcohol dehydrogenase family)
MYRVMAGFEQTQRTVAVTGAGSGIGRAIAEAFVAEGDAVYICDISTERVSEVASALGTPERGHTVDIANEEQIGAFLRSAHGETGRLDVLVNAAAIFDGYAGVGETSSDLWRKIIDINLTGPFLGTKVAAELMIPQGSGRIITIGSIATFRGGADGIAYTAAKAGLHGMTRRLAFDVGRHGITANMVCPGVIPSGIRANSAEVLGDLSPEQHRGIGVTPELMDFLIPAGRKGLPEEVAAVVVFLASEGAAYVNGTAVSVDGGWVAV